MAASGGCAYERDLYAVPFAVTANYSTKNLDFPETHDFLSKKENRVLVHWPLPQDP